jgi:hypothetical protein
VPLKSFVVKKGSKILFWTFRGIPEPVSAKVRANPRLPVIQLVAVRLRIKRRPARHGIERVADQVVEHLANLAFEADEGLIRLLPSFYLDVGVQKTPLIEGQNTLDKCTTLNRLGLDAASTSRGNP